MFNIRLGGSDCREGGLGNALKGVLFGLLLFLGSFVVLWLNEKHSAEAVAGLQELLRATVTVQADAVGSNCFSIREIRGSCCFLQAEWLRLRCPRTRGEHGANEPTPTQPFTSFANAPRTSVRIAHCLTSRAVGSSTRNTSRKTIMDSEPQMSETAAHRRW